MSSDTASVLPHQPHIRRVLVIGANGQIGDFLLPKLVAANIEVHAITRKEVPSDSAYIHWYRGDLNQRFAPAIDCDAIVHLAYLPLLPIFLDIFKPTASLKHVIAFSSTSRFTKALSPDPAEQGVANALADAEAAVMEMCTDRKVAWTLMRPTLIYGRGKDGNVTTISRFIRRFHVFPLVQNGNALRQPVHAEDLAEAVMLALKSTASYDKDYNLSGGETLSYREMVTRIYQSIGKKPCFIPTPLALVKLLMNGVRLLPGYRHLSMEMATRMLNDLCFSHEAATRDFGYKPGPYRPEAANL